MYPDLFGINDSSYVLLIIIGVICAFILLFIYLRKRNVDKNGIIDILICATFAVLAGIVGGVLTQNLYDVIKDPSHYKWTWAMTFYGGLLFGAVAFIVLFKFIVRNEKKEVLQNIIKIAPACITLAHAFGRIGCLLAGCCYGVETESLIGMKSSCMDDLNHVPVQLFESIFLFILSAVLITLAFKKDYKYSFCIYFLGYGIFRFIIEFFRADERGQMANSLSPSQWWCIVLVLAVVPLYLFFKYIFFKKEEAKHE